LILHPAQGAINYYLGEDVSPVCSYRHEGATVLRMFPQVCEWGGAVTP